MDEHEALAVLGLRAVPSKWTELQQAFEDNARLARRRVQFPLAGVSRDAALDELDRVNAAWVMLQNKVPCPAPRSAGRGVPLPPPRRYAPVSPPASGPNGLRILWDTLRAYLPKILAWVWEASSALWLFAKQSWRAARVTARWLAALFQAYIRFMCRVTGASPAKVAAATAVPLIVVPLVFFFILHSRTPETPAAVDFTPTLQVAATESPPVENEPHKSLVQFLTWPPANIFMNDEFLVEAPSPKVFDIAPGLHSLELVSKNGAKRRISWTVLPGRTYVLKFNFDTGQLLVDEVKP